MFLKLNLKMIPKLNFKMKRMQFIAVQKIVKKMTQAMMLKVKKGEQTRYFLML